MEMGTHSLFGAVKVVGRRVLDLRCSDWRRRNFLHHVQEETMSRNERKQRYLPEMEQISKERGRPVEA